jgi:hypothetical protein
VALSLGVFLKRLIVLLAFGISPVDLCEGERRGDSCEDTTNGVVLICIVGGVALLFEAIGEPLLLSS